MKHVCRGDLVGMVWADVGGLTENGSGAVVAVGFVGCEIDFAEESGGRSWLISWVGIVGDIWGKDFCS